MRSFKKCLTMLGVALAISFVSLQTFASEVGVVDLDNILANYTKAQDISADLKVKEADLNKFVVDAQKKLNSASTPLEKKNLEDKLTNDFKQKTQDFRDLQAKQYKMLEDNVYSAITTVSKSKKLDVILNKSSVLIGGTDITNEVLSLLNSKK